MTQYVTHIHPIKEDAEESDEKTNVGEVLSHVTSFESVVSFRQLLRSLDLSVVHV